MNITAQQQDKAYKFFSADCYQLFKAINPEQELVAETSYQTSYSWYTEFFKATRADIEAIHLINLSKFADMIHDYKGKTKREVENREKYIARFKWVKEKFFTGRGIDVKPFYPALGI